MTDDLIISKIGIEICLSCPYPECESTESTLCDLLREEVDRIQGDREKNKDAKLQRTLDIIEQSIEDKPQRLVKIIEDHGFDYGFLQSLIRRGILRTAREKWHKRTRILIIGVNRK